MDKIKIHVLRTGEVRVSPYLPFGGDNCSLLKASGITTPKSQWLWLPVFCFLIEHPKGLLLFDTGWHRDMSPNGVFDKKAQIHSLGSWMLYQVNQGLIAPGEAIDEQLQQLGISPATLDYVLLSHLDCDHANGLRAVKEAKHILVAKAELEGTRQRGLQTRIRFQPRWWQGVDLQTFDWNGKEGPVGLSFDLWGDGSIVMVNIPGHTRGLCALKVKNSNGRFALLFADGGYATRSWRGMITSGIALDKNLQHLSLQWIREQSLSPLCVESLASHDPDIQPHTIEF
ncbi:MAG: N-acyl homoserine lactonase family protein [Bacteroidales bacterium]|nr:N-acyl homoserine lactonase family protein [Bacteroidales bacterium]